MVFDGIEKATENIPFNCDKCDHSSQNLEIICIHERTDEETKTYRVCSGCKDQLVSDIENHYWYEVVSEEDFNRMISYLQSVEYIDCVYGDGYSAGDIIIHTKYGTSEVVEDACDHFGYNIEQFSVVDGDDEQMYECFEEHGKCLMVLLTPDGNIDPIPDPIENRNYSSLDYIDEDDRLFD